MPRPGEHILIIAHTFPPYRGIGGRRWAKFAKAFARQGHPVHVIHSKGPRELLGSLWTEDLRHPDIHPVDLPQRYPTVLFKRPLTHASERLAYHFWTRVLPLFAAGNYFDKAVFWRRQLLRTAGDLITRYDIRQVIVTGAPFRLMVHALELKASCGVALTCDFRDPWTWLATAYGQSLLSEERMAHERLLERRVVEGADRIVSPHPSVIDHLRKAYPEQAAKVERLPHAIDPDELGDPMPPRNDGEFRLIYAGSLYGAEEAEAYLEKVVLAFEALRMHDPERFAHVTFDLYITGHGVEAYREMVRGPGLEDRIRFHAPRPAKEIFRLIAASDAVLIFIPSFNKDLLGTKFTEVFHLRRPVIHVGEPGAVSRFIRDNRLGTSIPVDALATELPPIMRGERDLDIDPTHDLSAHLLDHIARRFLDGLDTPPATNGA
ncbi:MAG: glycosyltransferase [Flavobacteriales bacterium]|nr:glycosyltransferase [Flavobacteriales bacterium]MCB9166345.1 glycosyltransferase [Flavobacteriales bacterium]